jgi:hypothetical protein
MASNREHCGEMTRDRVGGFSYKFRNNPPGRIIGRMTITYYF